MAGAEPERRHRILTLLANRRDSSNGVCLSTNAIRAAGADSIARSCAAARADRLHAF